MSDNANDGVRAFAKAGITAALTINSGALIAALSQFESLQALPAESLADAITCWAFGVTAAAMALVFATFAASAYANSLRRREVIANWLGYISTLGSIGLFTFGALALAGGLPG